MATANLTACPQCQSTDTASVVAVYEHGTRDTYGDGPWTGPYGGTSSTRAAQRVGPPVARHTGTPTMLIVIGGIMFPLCVLFSIGSTPKEHVVYGVSIALFLAMAVVGIFWRQSVGQYNRTDHRAYTAKWSRQWTCKRCGNVFVP